MFPAPIHRASGRAQVLYRLALPVSLFVWLLPLLAILLTSVRSAQDLAVGDFWGWPHGIRLANYADVFTRSPMGEYLFNSVRITFPAVALTLVLSTLAGFGPGEVPVSGGRRSCWRSSLPAISCLSRC